MERAGDNLLTPPAVSVDAAAFAARAQSPIGWRRDRLVVLEK